MFWYQAMEYKEEAYGGVLFLSAIISEYDWHVSDGDAINRILGQKKHIRVDVEETIRDRKEIGNGHYFYDCLICNT